LHNDLLDFDLVEDTFKFRKHDTWGNLKKTLHEKFGIHPDRQRLWKWSRRNNKTYRPDTPIILKKSQNDATPLKDVLQHISLMYQGPDKIDIFIETACPRVPDTVPFEFPLLTDEHIFLLFKLYDPKSAKLSYMGHSTARLSSKPTILLPFLNSLINRQTDLPLFMFEEVRANMIERLDMNRSLKELELQHGDIIVYQLPVNDGHNYQFPFAPDIFKYLEKRVIVKFAPKDKPNDVACTVELMRDHDFNTVCTELYETLKKLPDPPLQHPVTHLRLLGSHSKQAYPSNVKNLKDMLTVPGAGSLSDTLLFEELPIPLLEYESKKHLTVVLFNAKVQEVETHKLLLEKTALIKDAIKELKSKIEQTGEIQLLDINAHEIRRVFKPTDPISSISGQSTLRAEAVEPLPADAGPNPVAVQVVHFDSKATGVVSQCHGNPFFFSVSEADTVKSTKDRIRTKLDMRKTEEFKLFVFFGTHQHHLSDDEARILTVIKGLEEKYSSTTAWKLAMDHRDTKRRTEKAANAIVIYN
jgi:ubiquitin carboxyl-terminal hydrolase 7